MIVDQQTSENFDYTNIDIDMEDLENEGAE